MDVGFIKQGAAVHLKVDAFNFQEHGMLEGKVRFISQDSFKRDTPTRVAADSTSIT
jgi:HlyD family secretion protein